ncbi:MAG TPA: DNA polymerase III subunit delta [Aggregatilineales bacterium]|nr:DNA polymerase III subunit delta [Aggregatilineales bacterium]
MSQSAPTFYVLHGEDEYSRKAEVKNMRARMGDPATAELNTAIFDGKTAVVADVLAAASAMPFLSDKRLIIVDGLLSWMARKGAPKSAKADLETLLAALPGLPDSARLVFVEPETLSDSHPVLKLVKQEPRGFARAFNPPGNPTNWIIKQVESYGGKIEPRAAAALAAVVGSDLRAADSECQKLSLYTSGQRAITEADVTLLTSYVAEAVIWNMVDALGKRDGKTASILLQRLLKDQEPLSLLPMIYRQFRLLIQAREALDAGGDKRDLLKLPDFRSDFVAQKAIEQARNFTMEQLEDIYRYLLDTDHGIKTGRVSDALALDLLVAGLSA